MMTLIVNAAPYLLGPLLSSGSSAIHPVLNLQLQVITLSLFFVWALLRRKVRDEPFIYEMPEWVKQRLAQFSKRTKDLLDIIRFATLVVIIVGLLHMLQWRVEENFFYFTLFSMSMLAVSDALYRRNNYRLYLAVNFLALFCVGYLSATAQTQLWLWQPLPMSAGLAGLLTAIKLASLQSAQRKNTVPHSCERSKKVISISKFFPEGPIDMGLFSNTYRALVVLSPVVATFPAYFGELPSNYLILLIVLPISGKTLRELYQPTLSQKQLQGLERHAKQCTLLTILLLILLRLL